MGSITFSEQFTQRYGPIHPAFYQGTLEDAQKEACNKPAKDVRYRLTELCLYNVVLSIAEENLGNVPASRRQRSHQRVLHAAARIRERDADH